MAVQGLKCASRRPLLEDKFDIRATPTTNFDDFMALSSLLASLRAHPRLWATLLLLPPLLSLSPLALRLAAHAFALLAAAAAYATWAATTTNSNSNNNYANNFVNRNADANSKAAAARAPVRQFPLCAPARWAPVVAARRREAAAAAASASAVPRYVDSERVQALLNAVVSLVVRSFVLPWYLGPITTEPILPLRIEQALHCALAELRVRIDRINLVQFAIAKVAPLITAHVREFRRAEYILRAERIQRHAPVGDQLDGLIVRYYLAGNLHPAVSTAPAPNPDLERAHLRNRLRPIVLLLFPKTETGSRIISSLLREILVCKVLQPIIDMLSDPDYWNQLFDSLAESIIQQEQSLGRKFDDILDRDGPFEGDGLDFAFTGLQPQPSSFDEFLKQIKTCDSLAEIVAIRDAVAVELAKRRNETAGFDGDEVINGARVSKIRTYINRLHVAQKRADKRIAALGGGKSRRQNNINAGAAALAAASSGGGSNTNAMAGSGASASGPSGPSGIAGPGATIVDTEEYSIERPTLSTILEDQHMLPFFTEYMEFAGCLRYVQLWARVLVLFVQLGLVDSLNLQDLDEALDLVPTMADSWEMRPISDDICRINADFFAQDAPARIQDISPATLRALQTLAEGLATENEDVMRELLVTRGELRLLHQALVEVFQVMMRDIYPGFVKSPMFMRMIEQIMIESQANDGVGLVPKDGGVGRTGQIDCDPRTGMPLSDTRTSNESERNSFDTSGAAGDYELNIFDDPQRKLRGKGLIDAMLKVKRRFANRSHNSHSGSADPADELQSPMPVRIETTTNLEGELHAIVNSDENSFVSFLRKKASRRAMSILGGMSDDRHMRSREELAQENHKDNTAKSTETLSFPAPGASATETDDSKSGSGGMRIPVTASLSNDTTKQVFSIGNFRRRDRHGDKHDIDVPLSTRPILLDTPARLAREDDDMSRRRSNSLDSAKIVPKLFITNAPYESGNATPSRKLGDKTGSTSSAAPSESSASLSLSPPGATLSPKSTPLLRHMAVHSGGYTSAVNLNNTPSNLANTNIGSSSNSLPTQQSPGETNVLQRPSSHNARSLSPPSPAQFQLAPTTPPGLTPVQLSSKVLLHTPSHTNVKDPFDSIMAASSNTPGTSSAASAAYSESLRGPESDQSPSIRGASAGMSPMGGGDDEDDDPQQVVAGAINLTGVPRPRQDLLTRYQSDQDILPPMIVMPKRVIQINEEAAKLRVELEEVEREREKIEQSLSRVNRVSASPTATQDDTESQRRLKQLRFMCIGIDEEHKRLVSEKRRLEFDELDNVIMSDRTTVWIGDSQTASDDGRDYAVYPVQVQRANMDGVASGWIVMRRYSEFLSMHHALRSKHSSIVGQYEMPGKLLGGIIKLKRQSLELRRASLERYLQNLLRHPEICRSVEFRKFLCHQDISRLLFVSSGGGGGSVSGGNSNAEPPTGKRSFFKNIIQSVDEGFDSFRQRLRPPVGLVHQGHAMVSEGVSANAMAHMSSYGANMSPALSSGSTSGMNQGLAYPYGAGLHPPYGPSSSGSTASLQMPSGLTSEGHSPDFPPMQSLSAMMHMQGSSYSAMHASSVGDNIGMGNNMHAIYATGNMTGTNSSGTGLANVLVTDVMIDLFIELFELKERNNWLRRQAVVIILQQLFGGTVERRVTEAMRSAMSEDNAAYLLESIRTTFWPGPDGAWAPVFPERTPETQKRTRVEAQGKLAALLPELLGGMVGRHNARRGAVRWCSAFQSRRLNQHLVHVFLDDVLNALFPETVGLSGSSSM